MKFEMMTPETTEELLKTVSAYQDKPCRFGAGYTDLMLELQKEPESLPAVINLARLKDPEFTTVQDAPDGIRIGALVTIQDLSEHSQLNASFPVLCQAARQLGSRQVRNVATLGGNLCTASPAGDVACAVTALQGQCEILSASGGLRSVDAKDFFTGLRTTVLGKDELLRSVVLPRRPGSVLSRYIKVGTRRAMECSVVSMAIHMTLDDKGAVSSAGVALGSVAPTIVFAEKASKQLLGANPIGADEAFLAAFTEKVMSCATPISDVRAGAEYRSTVLKNLCGTVFDQN